MRCLTSDVQRWRDVLAGEVDDRVAAGERVGRRGPGHRIPAARRSTPGSRRGTVGVARERGDLVAAGDERLRQSRSRCRPSRPSASPACSALRLAGSVEDGTWERRH